jgi:RHS repeat-associated protein
MPEFTTYNRDSYTTLDYADQRFYASSYGRFNTPDPYQATGASSGSVSNPSDPGSWNRYSYTRGDPINRLDRSGQLDEAPGDDDDDPDDPDQGAVLQQVQGPSIDCNAITQAAGRQAGIDNLTYSIASRIWTDGSLYNYSTDSTAATIAALATVTWKGESNFSLNPKNNGNYNNGALTSVDYGPLQINQSFHPNSNSLVWGTAGAGQVFNGDPDTNITFGISILEGLSTQYGNNAAGRYVGSLGNWTTTVPATPTSPGHQAGTPINPNAQKREASWNSGKSALTGLFGNTNCFGHQ